jgi:hypothetical protein
MRSTVLLPPDRRMQGRGAVSMLGQPPAGPFVRKKVHVENPAATARAYHGRLFPVPVLLDHVENPPPEIPWQRFLNHDRPVRPNDVAINPQPDSPAERPDFMEKFIYPDHAGLVSASSIKPRTGVVSPAPAWRWRISQTPSSGSVMISILARLKITVPYLAFASSRKG